MTSTHKAPDTFRAVTWNPHHHTPTTKLEPILRAQLAKGVTVFLMQEAGGDDIERMLRRNGLDLFHAAPQYVVAWVPTAWVGVTATDVELAMTAYYATGKKEPIATRAASVILCDRAGRSIEAVSYHTAPFVQVAPKLRPVRRVKSLTEAMTTLRDRARNGHTRAFLSGGDDNVDEGRANSFPFLLEKFTGLRLVQAPAATHGKVRRIDDFRTKGLRPLGGWVAAGGGDHKLHGREFGWL